MASEIRITSVLVCYDRYKQIRSTFQAISCRYCLQLIRKVVFGLEIFCILTHSLPMRGNFDQPWFLRVGWF
ncbi:unnamed protein product, partial [Linum tenue]